MAKAKGAKGGRRADQNQRATRAVGRLQRGRKAQEN